MRRHQGLKAQDSWNNTSRQERSNARRSTNNCQTMQLSCNQYQRKDQNEHRRVTSNCVHQAPGHTLGAFAPLATAASYRRCASPAMELLMSLALTVAPCAGTTMAIHEMLR